MSPPRRLAPDRIVFSMEEIGFGGIVMSVGDFYSKPDFASNRTANTVCWFG